MTYREAMARRHGGVLAREMHRRDLAVQTVAGRAGMTTRAVRRRLTGVCPLAIDELVDLFYAMDWSVEQAVAAIFRSGAAS